jgi:UDP-2,3-diacylglucosamine pyrophosphatase LpxH
MAKFKAEKINGMTVVVDVQLEKGEKEFHIFSSPDHHWDNPKCQRDLLREHLDEAKRLNAAILMPGDTFCMMQGKYDPRRNKADVRPEHNVSNYIDAVISDAAKFYAPYKENIIALGNGNHESSILQRLETNVLERFAGEMGGGVPVMGYHGWVVFKIREQTGKQLWAYKIYFRHGSGGGGPVTRGQIEFSRYMMEVEGADCITAGHIHEKNNSEVMVHYFDTNPMAFKPKARSVLLLRSSTYKQEYTKNGWHVERGAPPKPLGGNFLTLHLCRATNNAWINAEAKIRTNQPFDIG